MNVRPMTFVGQLKRGFSKLVFSPTDRALTAAREMGLGIDLTCPIRTARDTAIDDGRSLLKAGAFQQYEAQYRQAFEDKTKLPDGRNVYAALERSLSRWIEPGMTPVAIAEDIAWGVEKAWEKSGRSPFMSAVLGQLLFSAGYCHRGVYDASHVSPKGWEMLAKYSKAAQDAFYNSAAGGIDCPFWNRALFGIAQADGSSEEEHEHRFQNALRLDPLDIDLYLRRTYMLLPRWYGSYEEIERFAVSATHSTRKEYGNAMYARIYWSIADMESLPHTDADWAKLKRGFEDWLGQVPLQPVVNSFASAAYMFGDFDTLTEIATKRLTDFHIEDWLGDSGAADALEWLVARA